MKKKKGSQERTKSPSQRLKTRSTEEKKTDENTKTDENPFFKKKNKPAANNDNNDINRRPYLFLINV